MLKKVIFISASILCVVPRAEVTAPRPAPAHSASAQNSAEPESRAKFGAQCVEGNESRLYKIAQQLTDNKIKLFKEKKLSPEQQQMAPETIAKTLIENGVFKREDYLAILNYSNEILEISGSQAPRTTIPMMREHSEYLQTRGNPLEYTRRLFSMNSGANQNLWKKRLTDIERATKDLDRKELASLAGFSLPKSDETAKKTFLFAFDRLKDEVAQKLSRFNLTDIELQAAATQILNESTQLLSDNPRINRWIKPNGLDILEQEYAKFEAAAASTWQKPIENSREPADLQLASRQSGNSQLYLGDVSLKIGGKTDDTNLLKQFSDRMVEGNLTFDQYRAMIDRFKQEYSLFHNGKELEINPRYIPKNELAYEAFKKSPANELRWLQRTKDIENAYHDGLKSQIIELNSVKPDPARDACLLDTIVGHGRVRISKDEAEQILNLHRYPVAIIKIGDGDRDFSFTQPNDYIHVQRPFDAPGLGLKDPTPGPNLAQRMIGIKDGDHDNSQSPYSRNAEALSAAVRQQQQLAENSEKYREDLEKVSQALNKGHRSEVSSTLIDIPRFNKTGVLAYRSYNKNPGEVVALKSDADLKKEETERLARLDAYSKSIADAERARLAAKYPKYEPRDSALLANKAKPNPAVVLENKVAAEPTPAEIKQSKNRHVSAFLHQNIGKNFTEAAKRVVEIESNYRISQDGAASLESRQSATKNMADKAIETVYSMIPSNLKLSEHEKLKYLQDKVLLRIDWELTHPERDKETSKDILMSLKRAIDTIVGVKSADPIFLTEREKKNWDVYQLYVAKEMKPVATRLARQP